MFFLYLPKYSLLDIIFIIGVQNDRGSGAERVCVGTQKWAFRLKIWWLELSGQRLVHGADVVCAELANRGVKDVLIVCRDGLTGFPEAIAAHGRPRQSRRVWCT
jgi:hypothetical protein